MTVQCAGAGSFAQLALYSPGPVPGVHFSIAFFAGGTPRPRPPWTPATGAGAYGEGEPADGVSASTHPVLSAPPVVIPARGPG